MKQRWRKSVYVTAIVVLVLLPLAYAGYEEDVHESIFLVRPENQYIVPRTIPTYLSSEDLTFFACTEYDNTPIRLSVLCTDNNNFLDVGARKWGPDFPAQWDPKLGIHVT